MGLLTPPAWFMRELNIIDPEVTVRFNDRQWRWIAYNPDGSVYERLENKDKSYRPLDVRFLRKLRIDKFFTNNSKAFDALLEQNHYDLRSHITRGKNGVVDYLSGYWD